MNEGLACDSRLSKRSHSACISLPCFGALDGAAWGQEHVLAKTRWTCAGPPVHGVLVQELLTHSQVLLWYHVVYIG